MKQTVTLSVEVQFIQNLKLLECGVSVSAAANLTRIMLLFAWYSLVGCWGTTLWGKLMRKTNLEGSV